jgi:ATP-dependent exoDNAse (exonuclease V) beta subunit
MVDIKEFKRKQQEKIEQKKKEAEASIQDQIKSYQESVKQEQELAKVSKATIQTLNDNAEIMESIHEYNQAENLIEMRKQQAVMEHIRITQEASKNENKRAIEIQKCTNECVEKNNEALVEGKTQVDCAMLCEAHFPKIIYTTTFNASFAIGASSAPQIGFSGEAGAAENINHDL